MDAEQVMKSLEIWITILVPILALLAGTGWIKFLLERRDRKRDRERERNIEALKLLTLIEKRFVQTQRISQEFMDELEVRYLEYPPSELRKLIERRDGFLTV